MLKGQLSWLPFHFLCAISQHSLELALLTFLTGASALLVGVVITTRELYRSQLEVAYEIQYGLILRREDLIQQDRARPHTPSFSCWQKATASRKMMLLFSPDDTELAKDVLATDAHGIGQAL